MNNYISAVKRVKPYTLKSADITLNTALSNIDLIEINKNNLIGIVTATNPSSGQVLVEGRWEFKGTSATWNDSANNGAYTYSSGLGTNLFLFVTKGTYANLAAAQAALTGTKIIYQLATPVFIPFEDFDQYGINVEGALASHSGYTNVSYEGDIVPDVSVTYAMDLGAGILSVKDSTATALSLATETYNIIDQDWQSWTPTLTWTGATPTISTSHYKYKLVGSVLKLAFDIIITNGLGATSLKISIPSQIKNTGIRFVGSSQQLINTTYTNPMVYINSDDSNGIQFNTMSTFTNGLSGRITGFVECEVI